MGDVENMEELATITEETSTDTEGTEAIQEAVSGKLSMKTDIVGNETVLVVGSYDDHERLQKWFSDNGSKLSERGFWDNTEGEGSINPTNTFSAPPYVENWTAHSSLDEITVMWKELPEKQTDEVHEIISIVLFVTSCAFIVFAIGCAPLSYCQGKTNKMHAEVDHKISLV